jgi:hypothetical protein
MRTFLFAAITVVFIAGCVGPVHEQGGGVNAKHGLTGGVKEPVYPPDGPINCWVQPPHDVLWYPCPQKSDAELGAHGH